MAEQLSCCQCIHYRKKHRTYGECRRAEDPHSPGTYTWMDPWDSCLAVEYNKEWR